MDANRGDYRGLGEAIEERFRFSFSVTLSARGVVKLTGHSRRDVFRWVSALVVGGGGGEGRPFDCLWLLFRSEAPSACSIDGVPFGWDCWVGSVPLDLARGVVLWRSTCHGFRAGSSGAVPLDWTMDL